MALKTVTKEEFFAALYADRRDIMPTNEAPDRTYWRTNDHVRTLFGITSPGWRNPGDPASYALVCR